MQDQLTDHLDQQLKSTSLENFSNYLKNLQQLPENFADHQKQWDITKLCPCNLKWNETSSFQRLSACFVSWGSHGSENDAACSSDRSVRRTLCKSPKGCSDHDAYQ